MKGHSWGGGAERSLGSITEWNVAGGAVGLCSWRGRGPVSWCGNKNGDSGARCGQGCDGVKTAPPGREETSVRVKSWLTGGVKMLAESTGFAMLQDKSREPGTRPRAKMA